MQFAGGGGDGQSGAKAKSLALVSPTSNRVARNALLRARECQSELVVAIHSTEEDRVMPRHWVDSTVVDRLRLRSRTVHQDVLEGGAQLAQSLEQQGQGLGVVGVAGRTGLSTPTASAMEPYLQSLAVGSEHHVEGGAERDTHLVTNLHADVSLA